MREEDFPQTVCGWLFTREELDLIRKNISLNPPATRMQISREVCAALSWVKPDGGLKEMSCRVVLLKLHRAGIIQLPPPRFPHHNGRRMKRRTPQGEPPALINKELRELLPLELRRTTAKKEHWNELIDRYPYLGYTPLPGAQVRSLVYSPLGCLGARAARLLRINFKIGLRIFDFLVPAMPG